MKRRALLILAGLAIAAAYPPAGSAAPRLSAQGSLRPAASHSTITVLWRDRSDFRADASPETLLAAGHGRVFFLQRGTLVAAELATGKRLWTYGSGVKGPVAYTDGKVYLVGATGDVVALSASTGRRLWRLDTGLDSINRFQTHRQVIFANGYQGGAAIEVTSGRIRWRISEFGSHGPAAFVENIVLWHVYQGEPGFDHILAHDLRTGRRLWRVGHAHGPLETVGSRLYLADEWVWTQLDDPENVQIRIIELPTGKELGRWRYRADLRCEPRGAIPLDWKRGEEVLSGPYLYVGERCGDQVARFARGGARKPLRRYVTFEGGQWRAGPFQGLLFFVTKNHRLLGVRLDGGHPQRIGGVTMATGQPRRYETTGAPIVRLDLDDRYVYVSQRDGWFRILDFRSGKRLFAVRASPGGLRPATWEFRPVIRSSDYLIVQPEGEVVVLRVPR